MHCVEAYLDQTHHLHSARPGDRDAKMAALCPASIYSAHNRLMDFSVEARYKIGVFAASFVRATVLDKYLARVARVTRWVSL